MTRLSEGSFAPIRPDETDFFAFDFSKEIGVAASFIGSITNDTLTVSVITNGVLQVEHLILASSVLPGTRIIGYDSASGGTGTYKVDLVQSVASGPMSVTADITEVVWTCTVFQYSRVPDPTPEARMLSDPSISANVTSILIGTMIDGVAYILTATATLSDGRVLVSTADVLCVLTLTPGDEVLTVPEFRTIMPAFSDEAKYNDATSAYWINQATTMPVIDPIRWGQFYNMGIGLWVAHILTMGNAQRNMSGYGSGVPASKSVNGVSISYDTTLGQEANAGFYGLTPYGNMFLHYLRMAGAGPIQVGTGYYWNLPGTVVNPVPMGGRPFIPWSRPW